MRVRWPLTAVLAIVVLCIAGASYQLLADWRDAHRFPQHGKIIQTRQTKLNLDCADQGGRTVVLDIGTGLAREWQLVQPEVAKFTRVCSYDRAGSGWSESGREPRTSAQIAGELKDLLDAAGEKGPYILVGHSIAGIHARVFAGKYPEEVAGMVLVEGASEDDGRLKLPCGTETPGAASEHRRHPHSDQDSLWHRACVGRRRLGGHEADHRTELEHRSFPAFPRGDSRVVLSGPPSEPSQGIGFREWRVLGGERQPGPRLAESWGHKPLIVLTAANPVPVPFLHDPLIPNPEQGARLWIEELQGALARLSTRGKQIVVADSDHMIPLEHPEAVVSAIREVVAEP